jgi:hypothetical protein
MKDAKDYKRDDGNGVTTITSFAHFLTGEGLNVFTASLLRDAIETSTDDEFKEAFDDASKDEAREFLYAYQLSFMPYWGADELAKAIHDSDQWRDEKLVLRAVTLAQKAGEIPDVFTPKQGVEWAMDRGYLIRYYAGFVCAAPGIGHPHNLLSDGPHHKINALAAQAPPVETVNAPLVSVATEWKELAKTRAREIIKEHKLCDRYPSQIIIADTIAKEFRSASPKVLGVDGKPLAGAYIKRHALNGISSAQDKQLSTKITAGK